MDSWSSKNYSQFLDLRTRPARDLLASISDAINPKLVYDLGCGPGNSTILLKNRWPNAEIIGLDSSLNMLEEARVLYPDIKFIQGNIADFSPPEKIDCFFANASLQWLDDHEVLLPKLIQFLHEGGAFGIQMPNNFHSPSHQVTLKILQTNENWNSLLKQLRYGILKEPFYNLSWYYDLLIKAGAKNIQLWETEYFQQMSDHQGIFEWIKSTGLRPILTQMNSENQKNFENLYVKAVSNEYPVQVNNKIMLPFKRIFMTGYK
jgi:trans-aconitate 2-methyltransferase